MIKINLLPVKASRRQDQVKRELILANIGLVGLLALCGVGYMMVASEVSELKAENSQLQKDIENLKAIVSRVEEVDELKKDLQTKLDVIAGLKANKQGPVRMLDELSSATPEKLSVRELTEVRGRVTLTGLAVSNEVISQFRAMPDDGAQSFRDLPGPLGGWRLEHPFQTGRQCEALVTVLRQGLDGHCKDPSSCRGLLHLLAHAFLSRRCLPLSR